MTQTAADTGLIAALAVIAAEAPDEGLTLNGLLSRLGDRAFGVAMFTLAAPCCIPLLFVLPQIVSVPMLVIAAQMLWGREEPWLPQNLGNRRVAKDTLVQLAVSARKYFGWLERLGRPRLQRFTGMWGERVCGVFFVIFILSILIPFPFTNGVPAAAIVCASLGLLMSDGLLVLIGLAVGSLWVVGYTLFLAAGGIVAVNAIMDAFRNIFGG